MFETLAAGAVLGLSAGLSPGPLLALVVAQSLRHGMGEGAKVALSPLITDLPIIAVSLLVLSQVQGHAWLLGAVSLAGAVFVGKLGLNSLATPRLELDPASVAPRSLRQGVVVNLLSPHPYLFWITVGAPTILKGYEKSPLAAAGFLALFYVALVGAKLLVAVLSGASRRLLAGPAYAWTMRLLGLLLLVFAALLVRDGLRLFGILGA